MNTFNLADNVVATLLANPKTAKLASTTIHTIHETIVEAMPQPSNDKLTEAGRDLLTKVAGLPHAGVMLDTVADHIILHVPSCQPADKTGRDHVADSIPAQSISFELSSYDLDSVRYFAHALSGLWIRHSFDQTIKEGKMTPDDRDNLHRYKLVSEVIPVLRGELAAKPPVSSKTAADYADIATNLGIPSSIFDLGTGYMLPPKGQGLIIETTKADGAKLLAQLERAADFDKAMSWLCTNEISGAKLTVTRTPRKTLDPDTLDEEITGYGFTFRPVTN